MFSNHDIGIDLGTANTLVYVLGKGIVVREPSVIAICKNGGAIQAVGQEAKQMIGRTPSNIVAKRPMKDGVIADFQTTSLMLKHFISKALKTSQSRRLIKPRVMVSVPSGITAVEKRAVVEAALEAGAKHAQTIEEPMAAAIGAGLPVNEATGSMVVDIGGGTTEIAVLSLGGIVTSSSIRVAGEEMDEVIIQYMKQKYNLLIGERTAENLKITIASADIQADIGSMDVRGRDILTGLPRTVSVKSDEISEVLKEIFSIIIEAVKVTLEKAPPELVADLMDRGIILTGGGALLRNLDHVLCEKTGISVVVAEDPLDCVAIGTGKTLNNYDSMNLRRGGARKTRRGA